jgi:hypothetical protein
MTQDEFYSKLMQDVEYIFKTGFKLSPEMFMQTMSYASEQYELLRKRIAELEKDYSDMEYKFSCILDYATGARASKTNIDKDIAYKLIDEHVNFWVNSAIAELEASQKRSCYSCEEYRDYTEDEKELYHEDGVCLKGDGCAYKVYQDFCCNRYEPKDSK